MTTACKQDVYIFHMPSAVFVFYADDVFLLIVSVLEEKALNAECNQPVCYVWADWVNWFLHRKRENINHHNRR